MNDTIIFQITEDEHIEVQRISYSNEKIHRYEEVNIAYRGKNQEYLLYSNDFISEALSVLQKLLKKAIDKELELHGSIVSKGIGFLSNENFQNSTDLVMIKGKEGEYWVGDKYLLWESMEYQTWIYNIDNEIVIEITPTYRWHFDEPDESDEYITYQEFQKNYTTCFTKTISKSVAENWLNQCQNILSILI
jgi:NAD+--asparagine ADP-ribosyltransferase